MYDIDWEELISWLVFANFPKWDCKKFLEIMTTTHPEMGPTPSETTRAQNIPTGLLNIAPSSPRPKLSTSTKQKKPKKAPM